MRYKYNENNILLSQTLRKNMTKEEKHLWYDFLKKLPFTVKRQETIGDFIVDFYITKYNIVIEVDGRQHKMKEHEKADQERDRELSRLGIKVLRYTNSDISCRFNEVCKDILKNMGLTFEVLDGNS